MYSTDLVAGIWRGICEGSVEPQVGDTILLDGKRVVVSRVSPTENPQRWVVYVKNPNPIALPCQT